MVHPVNSGNLWKHSNSRAATRVVSPSSSPHKGMFMCIPVGSGLADCFFHLLPGLKTSSLQSQRAQGLPPWFNQVEIGHIFGLKDEFPPRMSQIEEQHIPSSMDIQIVQDRIHPLGFGRQPCLHSHKKLDPVLRRPSGVADGQDLPRCRLQRQSRKDRAAHTQSLVSLVLLACQPSARLGAVVVLDNSWLTRAPSHRDTLPHSLGPWRCRGCGWPPFLCEVGINSLAKPRLFMPPSQPFSQEDFADPTAFDGDTLHLIDGGL